MNKKIITSVLAVAFAFSMVGSAGAVTLEELQAQFNDLLAKYNLLLAQIGPSATAGTVSYPAGCTSAVGFSITTGLSCVCKDNTCIIPSCTDSDGGMNYYVKGTVIYNGQTYTDSCDPLYKCESGDLSRCVGSPSALKEYYCENNEVKNTDYTCSSGYTCQNGACKLTVVTTKPTCSVIATANPNPIPTGKNQTTVSATILSATSLDKCKIGSLSLPHQFTQSGSSQVYTVSCTGISGYSACSDEIIVTKQGTTTKPPTTKYSCNTSTWTCFENPNGVYTSSASCKLNCPRSTAIYSCNKTVWACYVDTATGEYFAIEDCQANCIKPTTPTGRCSDGNACSWCGNQCVKVTSGMMCPQVMPPTGATCACVNNSCVQVYTRTSAINDILDKLSASLISIIEFLKR